MLYNARSDGDGTATINPAYLSLTTYARSETHALDTTSPTADVCSQVHNNRSSHHNAATSPRPVEPYPAVHTCPDQSHSSERRSLPEAKSAAQPPALAEGEPLEDTFPAFPSSISRDYYPDAWALLHQSLHDPSLLTYSFEDDGSRGQSTHDTHAASGSSWLSAYTHTDAGTASGGAALWGGASSAPGYSSLQDALLSPPVGSSKRRKMQDSDPESDTEGVSAERTSTSKRRKVQDTSPAPTPTTAVGDGPELSVEPKKRSQRRSSPEARAVKAQGSKRIRHGHRDGIEALRQSRKLFPNLKPEDKKPTKAEVIQTASTYIESSTPKEEADQLKETINVLKQENVSLGKMVVNLKGQLREQAYQFRKHDSLLRGLNAVV